MHRYEELEKLYYKKIFLKIFFYFIFFILFIGGVIFLFKNIHLFKNNKLKKVSKIKIEKKRDINKTINKKNSKNNVKPKKIKQKNNEKNNQKLKFILPNINLIKEPKIVKKENENNVSKENNISKIKNIKKEKNKQIKKISIIENNANINVLVKEYKQNKNYDVAMTIAKIYFEKNDLKQAQIWALNANSLNPSKPDSWLLFADILIKQNKLKKAKELLKAYIDSYGNNDIIEKKLKILKAKQ